MLIESPMSSADQKGKTQKIKTYSSNIHSLTLPYHHSQLIHHTTPHAILTVQAGEPGPHSQVDTLDPEQSIYLHYTNDT